MAQKFIRLALSIYVLHILYPFRYPIRYPIRYPTKYPIIFYYDIQCIILIHIITFIIILWLVNPYLPQQFTLRTAAISGTGPAPPRTAMSCPGRKVRLMPSRTCHQKKNSVLPSGKLTQRTGKSHFFLMGKYGKSTISMAM